MRRRPALLAALTAAALVAVALAGCAPAATRGPGNQPAGCTPALPSGDASSTVTTKGTVGKAPKVSFPTPLVGSGSQATVTQAGHGMVAQTGYQVDFEYTVYNATTGESIGGTGYDGTQSARAAAGVKVSGRETSITEALVCTQTGERLALTTTAKASFGAGTLAQYGIADKDTIVVVMDVLATYLGKADGVNQLPQDGMPSVVTAVDGQPGVVIQELAKPTTARSEVVKAGSGSTLKAGQQAVMLFTAWTWPSGASTDTTGADKPTVVDSLDQWSARQAASIALTPISKGGQLPAAFVDAVIGQKVGSQLLIVLPPKAGFPAASEPSGITSGDTVIFVVDLLGIQH